MMASLDKKTLNSVVQDFVKNNMMGFCQDRCFERLPGFIDVNVLSTDGCQTLAQPDHKLAIPVCMLSEADEVLLGQYQSLLEQQKQQDSNKLSNIADQIDKVMADFHQQYNDIKNDLDKL